MSAAPAPRSVEVAREAAEARLIDAGHRLDGFFVRRVLGVESARPGHRGLAARRAFDGNDRLVVFHRQRPAGNPVGVTLVVSGDVRLHDT